MLNLQEYVSERCIIKIKVDTITIKYLYADQMIQGLSDTAAFTRHSPKFFRIGNW